MIYVHTATKMLLLLMAQSIYAAPASNETMKPAPSPIQCTPVKDSVRNICCRQSKWYDLLLFYTINYLTHVATTRTRPGESPLATISTMAMALFLPMSGAMKGVKQIISLAIFADTDLQTAARAGALCMVVAVPDIDRKGIYHAPGGIATKIHGSYKLPPDHFLYPVPPNAKFVEDLCQVVSPNESWLRKYSMKLKVGIKAFIRPQQKVSSDIAHSYNLIKSLAAVLQAIFAAVTLYNSKGHQIDRFGYASFGLTVVPYAVMSLLNLLAGLICPEYSHMYLISNKVSRNLQNQNTAAESMSSVKPKTAKLIVNNQQREERGQAEGPQGLTCQHIGAQITSDQPSAGRELLTSTEQTSNDNSISEFIKFDGTTSTVEALGRNSDKQGTDMYRENLVSKGQKNQPAEIEPQQDQSTEDLKSLSEKERESASTLGNEQFCIHGTVGTLTPESEEAFLGEFNKHFSKFQMVSEAPPKISEFLLQIFAFLGICAIILVIIGLLSGFQNGQSTTAQRVWTMMWLVIGMYGGMLQIFRTVRDIRIINFERVPKWLEGIARDTDVFRALSIIIIIWCGAPVIGGLVVVGQMIRSYGVCVYV